MQSDGTGEATESHLANSAAKDVSKGLTMLPPAGTGANGTVPTSVEGKATAAVVKSDVDAQGQFKRQRSLYHWRRRAAFVPAAALVLFFFAASLIRPTFILSISIPIVGMALSSFAAIIALLKIVYNAPSLADIESKKPGVSWAKHNIEVGAFTLSVGALMFFLSTQIAALNRQFDQEVRASRVQGDQSFVERSLNIKMCLLARNLGASIADEMCATNIQNNPTPRLR
ncbi:hypothetical protein [Endobacterium cereale]|uniref:hypothetical protein n=1 Tax=Endobacterium cereale TaxID=2663029 RepID=UPI002B47B8EA|nr:hypothetical protein [Endobacterium cereale]MEB2848195.1 hypothetical protein [Endobacterium cereale]